MIRNVLVIGGGGREHAICLQLSKSKNVGRIYAAPGNAGIAQIAECIPIKATDIDGIAEFVERHRDIYLTVVASDDPLSLGLVDRLMSRGHRVFGPTKAAAEIESSKIFAKKLMKKYKIPTASFADFDQIDEAQEYLKTAKFPLVIKADGLALGKGVIVCQTIEEAEAALVEMMRNERFGDAGTRVVIEQFLKGYEVSVLAFTDGKTLSLMPAACDYKRAFDKNLGPNTGGMGAFSPVARFEPLIEAAKTEIFLPTIKAMESEGRPFKGVLYFGLMVDGKKVKVVEFNARFGDPETQVVLPALKTDFLKVLDAVVDGELDKIKVDWDKKKRVCVVAASGGYPLDYKKGEEVFLGAMPRDTVVFHAGTTMVAGRMVTNGGRVLSVCAAAPSLTEARELAYAGLKKINFKNQFSRSDIADGVE